MTGTNMSRTGVVMMVGVVSMVGGVVVLTIPYIGYPWLRHSGKEVWFVVVVKCSRLE